MEWSSSLDMCDEYEKLIIRMNTPRVVIDNVVCGNATLVKVDSANKHGILLEAVQVLTDLNLTVATIDSEGPEAHQEYYIRHTDGCPVNSEAEKQRVIQCLEAAIERRVTEGLRLELCTSDRVGLLSDVTRIFRENGMSVTRAEVSTRAGKAVNVFYVTDTAGNPVDSKTVEAVRREIGSTILQVKECPIYAKSPPREPGSRFSLGNLFKSKSE